jgi:hypothetical protein
MLTVTLSSQDPVRGKYDVGVTARDKKVFAEELEQHEKIEAKTQPRLQSVFETTESAVKRAQAKKDRQDRGWMTSAGQLLVERDT